MRGLLFLAALLLLPVHTGSGAPAAKSSDLLRKARGLHALGRLDEAIQGYQKCVAQKTVPPDAILGLAMLLEEKEKDTTGAIALYRKLSSEGPFGDEASLWAKWLEEGSIQDPGNGVEYRRTKYERTLALLPESWISHFWLSSVLDRNQRPFLVQDHLERCLRIQEEFAPAHLRLGRIALEWGDRRKASEHLERYLMLDPGMKEASEEDLGILGAVSHHIRATGFKSSGLWDKAREEYAASLKAYGLWVPSLLGMAEALMALKEPDLGMTAYCKAIEADSRCEEAYEGLCRSLSDRGRIVEAAVWFERYRQELANPQAQSPFIQQGEEIAKRATQELVLQKTQVDRRSDLHNLGVSLLMVGSAREAAEILRNAVTVSPESADTRASLGNACVKIDALDEAIPAFEAALKLDPEKHTTRANLASAALKKRDVDRALSEYAVLTSVSEPVIASDAFYNIGVLAWERNDREKAVTSYMKAVATHPGCVKAWNNLGVCDEASGLLDAAEVAYLKALSLDPSYAGARLNLSALWVKQDRWPEARLCLEPLRTGMAWTSEVEALWQETEGKKMEAQRD